jgi:glycosyltransferase involved in cell wall biosynthesis/membrane-associated phospholipid phosphatase
MDERLLLWINQGWAHPFFDGLFWWVSQRWWFAFPLAAYLAYDAVGRIGPQIAARWFLALALTVIVGDLLGNQIKHLFAAPRPCAVIYEQLRSIGSVEPRQCGLNATGMPSNHALNFFAAATFVALTTTWRRWRFFLFAVAALVSLSRIYLGKHYPAQVLVGAGLGATVGWLGAWFYLNFHAVRARFSLISVTADLLNPLAKTMNPDPVAASTVAITQTEILRALPPHRLSLVAPLYNELDNVEPLLAGIHAALADYPRPWELIAVDDGSSDGTGEKLQSEAQRYGLHVRVLILQRNFGQTAAMQAGIDAARGEVIATLDGDLQNDPADIPRLVAQLLTDQLDLVVGWRQDRQDNVWLRTIPSRIANRLIGNITGVRLHDYGCSLKIYRADVIKQVRLYGEMHRFIPAWVSARTAPHRIQETVVNHRARQFGESKYGISRTFRVLVDLLSVYFFLRFLTRPGHFFGRIGLAFGGLGGLILAWLFAQKLFFSADIGGRPLLLTGVLLVLMGVQFLTTGVLSELITRIYFASSASRPYAIRANGSEALTSEAGWRTAHD